jgi:branched-chain amino acid transport system substrate-binding protein
MGKTMSQKKETLILLLSLCLTLGAVGIGVKLLMPSPSGITQSSQNPGQQETDLRQRMSYGERSLIPSPTNIHKSVAIQAFAEGDFPKAIAEFQQYLQLVPNDPEALIYLNNAKISKNALAFVVSVPIGKDLNGSQELLRGVAQSQTEINQKGGIKGVPLKILIANDDDDVGIAQQLGQQWVKNPEILGVIGHFGSNTTIETAKNVYEPQGLPMISPTSTSTEISELGNYIFRTVPSDLFAGNALANYMLKDLKKTKAAVFYNSQSSYSKSLKNVFTTALLGNGGEVTLEADLMAADFNPVEAVKQAKFQGAQVLMLAMNTSSVDKALLVIQANQGQLPLLGGDSAYRPQLLQSGGKNAVGMVVAIPWHVLAHPNSPFVQEAAQLWKTSNVNWRTAMAYDAAQAFITALGQDPSRQGIQKALSSPTFTAPGASGNVRFLPSGDRNQSVQLVIVQPGERSGFGYDFVPVNSNSKFRM